MNDANWAIDDSKLRETVLHGLKTKLEEVTYHADRAERDAAECHIRHHDEKLQFAAWNWRAAQHLQQAIDLIAAAPMPERENA